MSLKVISRIANLAFARSLDLLPDSLARSKCARGVTTLPVMMVFTTHGLSTHNAHALDATIFPRSASTLSNLKGRGADFALSFKNSLFLFGANFSCALSRARHSFCSQMRIRSGKFDTAGSADQFCAASARVCSLELHHAK